jgi:hypothetical protein
MSRTAVAQYRPGETFACTKAQFKPGAANGIGDACGATIRIHGYHWCAQVCPKCLANYWCGSGADYGIYPDFGSYYPADTAARVRANIAANGGQYIPTFGR